MHAFSKTFIAVIAIVLCAASTGAADSVRTATVHEHQIDQSGIQADLVLVDDGTSLNATGLGTGFEVGKFYLAEVYETGSKPGGPQACVSPFAPDDPRYISEFNQRFLGFWFFGPSTTKTFMTGSFIATPTGAQFVPGPKTGENYVPLSRLHTISVREVNFAGDTVLRSCGAIDSDGTSD
jgi:hypothetical protein